ncbi:hypothetical protein HPB47_023515 [Ixodes persulcatus]|uniref:Uncharacterized protein n=1 Tax=Ixodes persulcatus TaxID=34615 RepID=A0AC60Q6U2_IXOPE|nr:hypothetical protein HPB47_023515 [Ixodes persulcatus]
MRSYWLIQSSMFSWVSPRKEAADYATAVYKCDKATKTTRLTTDSEQDGTSSSSDDDDIGDCTDIPEFPSIREVLKLRAEVAGLHEIIEDLQRRIGQQQAAPIGASRTSNHFPLRSREELDALEASLIDEEHRSDLREYHLYAMGWLKHACQRINQKQNKAGTSRDVFGAAP